MAENGENMEHTEDDTEFAQHGEDYQALIDYGINAKVANELEKIYQSDLLQHSDLDERALDALKEFPADGGVAVLKEFSGSNLEHVSNKSAFLCGVMKTYRQKNKFGAESQPANKKGPDEAKIKEILDRTGYPLDVTTGQRKYGGPPPDWDGTQPGAGHEVFAGKIPKDIFEDELIPLFEQCGTIWDLRLMMDPMTGLNRGFCFVTYTDRDGAHEAVKQLDNYELRKGKHLKCNISVANLRLFVGNIPKSKTRDEITEEFEKYTDGLTEVIIYSSPDDTKKKNRGFAFLEYDSHKSASLAKRKLSTGRIKVWGCDIIVDWADPIEEPDNDTMSKVKVLYVRNLKAEVSEESLKEKFEEFGKVERVKKIKDYGFVHFEERESAIKAMDELNGVKMGESEMQISLAKPPSENRQKEKRKRAEAVRMMMGRWDDYWGPPSPRGFGYGGRGRMMRPPAPGRGGYNRDQDYDYYGDSYSPRGGYSDPYYDDYYGGYDDYDYGGSSFGASRGRGRGGPTPPPPPHRGRGGGHLRGGRGGGGTMGRGRGGARGSRGGGMGRAGRGGAGSRGAVQRGAGKRKIGGDHNQGFAKKRNTQDGNWGAQPIAQQPLSQAGGYDSQWYQDSYGQQWG